METSTAVLIALTVIYIPLFFYVRFGKRPKEKGVVPYGPTIMIKTKIGIKTIDRLGRYKRFWRICGFLSIFVVLFLMLYIVIIIFVDLALLPRMIGNGGMGIQYALAIPGINPMLPLVYGWIGLIIAMVFHELAHGMQSRANDIDIDSTGLLYAVVPIGAFVEPNEEQIEKADRKARFHLYAAGITMNFVIAMVMFILMASIASGAMVADRGDSPAIYGYTSDSPLITEGIPATSIITDISGTPITCTADLEGVLTSYGNYDITYIYKDDTVTKTVTLGLYVNSVVDGSPAKMSGISAGDYIISVNGNNLCMPKQFTDFMNTTTPGQEVEVVYRTSDGSTITNHHLTLGDKGGIGYMGVSTTVSGMSFTTPNTILGVGTDPYYLCETFPDYVNATLSYISSAFSGFSPVPESTHWWYHSDILPGDSLWIVLSLIYWTFWLNIVLAITNALPAVPFDGGLLFICGLDYIVERFVKDEKRRDRIVDIIASAVTYFMLIALVLVLLVIIF